MKSYLPLILGMGIVTYLPRLIPLITLTERPLPTLLRRFLLYIPYTALSALIVKGIIESDAAMFMATLVGLAFAALLSWFKGNMVLSVAGSILVSLIVLQM